MIGQWLERQSDEVLCRIADADQWCRGSFAEDGRKCLLSNAGLANDAFTRPWPPHDPRRPVMAHYDRLTARGGFYGTRWGAHVDRIARMIRDRARRILARRAIAVHAPAPLRSAHV